MSATAESPIPSLAEQLLKQSVQDACAMPMDAVIDTARAGQFTEDRCSDRWRDADAQMHDALIPAL
jgi:hypothetical protein